MAFVSSSGFCSDCGTILPHLINLSGVTCFNCRKKFSPEAFGDMEVEYTIHFNTYNADKVKKKEKEETSDGPVVERICAKCGHNQMSYATVQLRSVDEGQTIFYTCLKCNHKDSENS